MMNVQQPINNVDVDLYGSSHKQEKDDIETSSTGTFSVAASPHWTGPIKKAAAKAAKSQGFSPGVAFCFTINYILGAGFLTIPWAFVQSGLILSSIMLIVSAIGSDIAKDYMLETMSRAEAMLDDDMHWRKMRGQSGVKGENGHRILLRPPASLEKERLLQNRQDDEDVSATPVLSPYRKNGGAHRENDERIHKALSFQSLQNALNRANLDSGLANRDVVILKPKKYIVRSRKFEMNALCRIFLGKRGLRTFTMILSLYIFGTLWVYTSVYSSAMARALPVFVGGSTSEYDSFFVRTVATDTAAESMNYVFYAITFGCIVVPLSCLELEEQVPLQVFLTGCRFLMFFLMIGTSGLCSRDVLAHSAASSNMSDQEYVAPSVENFRWSGVAKTLPILIFANIFHHSIPGLAHPAADKRQIGKVFTATNVFTVTAYLILGLSLGSAFGEWTEQSSNLNWSLFHASTGELDSEGNVVNAAWWTKAISMYIILFPAIDVVSAYPLNAITLGNNLFGAVYGKRIHEVEKNRWLRTGFRLVASVPPIVFGILVRELGVITDYTGTTGFLIGLSFPAILYIASRTIAQRRQFEVDTFYSSYGSSIPIAKLMLWSGIFMVVFVFITLGFDLN